MVAATAAAVGLAIFHDRRLPAVRAEAAALPLPVAPPAPVASPRSRPLLDVRGVLAAASGFALVVIAAVSLIPVATTIATHASSSPVRAEYGPPAHLRAGAAAAGGFERSYTAAVPDADQVGAALFAAEHEIYGLQVLKALHTIADERAAQAAARSAGIPSTMNRPSGYAVGTVLRARITIYGCTGPGGGFCNNMASGIGVFEGAAACSNDLPFGTRVRIVGDPTGRVYECLDRGALPATWVDVYFHNTSEGMAWQSMLGGTVADVIIEN
jgi:hypothetical protein